MSCATDIAANRPKAALWATLMDETVAEVFATMLGLECLPAAAPRAPAYPVTTAITAAITARIRFSGEIDGECVLISGEAAAARLAEAFLGKVAGEAADEALISDSIGELCNMLAGGWKKRLGPPAWSAGLSVPIVSRNPHDETEPEGNGHATRAYRFENGWFEVWLAIENVDTADSVGGKDQSGVI